MPIETKNIIKYKEFVALFDYNADKDLFVAKTIKQPEDPFTFEAKSISSLEKEFAELVESYLKYSHSEGF